MKDPRNHDRSLAVVAMNLRQRDLIDEMLDREAARDRDIADYRRRWRNTLYPFIVRNLETVQGDERDVVMISTVYGPEKPGGPVMQRFGPIVQAGGERRLNVLFTRARLRVEVFSSMAANDIRVDARTSEGARVLRDYLEYAATGRIDPGHGTGRATDSPFEDYVLEKLRARGLEAEPQVGVAGYRIDLGVKHPDYPHGYLLCVECDGAAYHRARSARDRDRLREAVLRDLGWDIYRVWSTDWFADPDREMAKLLAHIDRRLEKARAAPPADAGEARRGPVVEKGSEPKAEPEAPENAEDIERQGGLFANGVALALYRTWRGVAPDPRFASVGDVAAALLGIVEAEGPVLEGRAYRAYARASNLQRLARQSRAPWTARRRCWNAT